MIRYEIADAVAIITIDRPERRNALGTALVQALAGAFTRAESEDSVHSIILNGSPPGFCAGSDLKELAQLTVPEMCVHEEETASVVRGISSLSKPVVASVEGFALGGGFMLAIACDAVVSDERAAWRLPEVANGWIPIWGMRALISRVGPARGRLLSWGAETITGAEAQRLGIVDYVAAPDACFEKSLAVAKSLGELPPDAVRSVKRYYNSYSMEDAAQADEIARRYFADDCLSPAAKATFARFNKPL